MKDLQVTNYNGVETIDSREVAEMVGKQHAHLMRDIHNYAEVIENSNESNFGLVDFFIPHTYTDSKGEERPCYLLTKKGCDMVANKMTGEKGVLFTAAYVTAFEKMREAITAAQTCSSGSPSVTPHRLHVLAASHVASPKSCPSGSPSVSKHFSQTFGSVHVASFHSWRQEHPVSNTDIRTAPQSTKTAFLFIIISPPKFILPLDFLCTYKYNKHVHKKEVNAHCRVQAKVWLEDRNLIIRKTRKSNFLQIDKPLQTWSSAVKN